MFIGIFNFLCGVGLALGGSLGFWPVRSGLDFYIPIVLFLAGYIGGIAICWITIDIIGRFLSLNKEPKKISKLARFIMTDAMRYINFLALARVEVKGKNKLPKNERFLFVQNHTSRFDPMVVNAFLPKYDIAFITKPGNYKIPLAKRLMPRLFYQAIDREDPIQSLGVMKNSIELIQNNVTSVGVYPEGTRHGDSVLGEFHEGVFSICIKAKCPLVISTIKNANMIHKNYPFKITRVTLEIVQVIPYELMEGKTAKQLSDEVHEIMQNNLK